MREPSDPLTRLVKQIDQRVEQAAGRRPGGRRLGTYVIFCSAAAGLDERLRQLAAAEQLKQLSLCIEPPTGPTRYEIAPEAAVTVLIFNSKRRVLANFALRKGELDEKSSSAILQALSLALP